ncbi:MAG: cellulose biosynthesis cyclic di-GMP-binding regulatory protein BcsB, partial [Ignavibacteria bacterium]|nr:cellulose biosynthesis cyclic di-GMP-binding regulatory protein BcsB [Ignavibacteria bacterium]
MFTVGIFGQAVQSVEAELRTMEDMGYRNESIRGIAGAVSFFLKLNPKDDVNNMRLVLKVKPSQVLNRDLSAVTVSLRDEPVYT